MNWLTNWQNKDHGKKITKEYHAIYELDPDESFLLDLYDVKQR